MLARYTGKSYGYRVETQKSFTLGVIGVAVSGPEEATTGRPKLLSVETATSCFTETVNPDLFTRLATIHQRYRQTRQTGSPKTLSLAAGTVASLHTHPDGMRISID